MEYEGKIYRPWPEASSFLIQTTYGCSHNKCTFCDMFREKKFGIRKVEDIYQDIEEARRMYSHIESFFLIDGNVMAIKTDLILKVLQKIKATFPECNKISLYSQYNDFRRKSVEDLKLLKEAGLTMAYVGLESGDRQILEEVKKSMTPEQAIEGAEKAKEAGIKVLASFVFGLGGRDRSKEHIEETTKLLNILKPEEIAPMALAVQPGTELEEQVKSGKFVQATRLQMLEEEKYLLENMDFDTFYWGDHGNNVVSLKGDFRKYKKQFLGMVENAIKNPDINKESVHETFSW
ncbi:B12-binding domain-containing radical SAM protein [Labilibacter marinus]|uniref:B12-binding domain-containing radical SAM protein n=1 Tax=Labilibacter marinus TaxID=1477105 RepID=UPI0008356E92|nr:radical SAM protein [Labilibacter marinus]